ncbi:hypothetical protein CYLTODRAFT_103302 [Cylindrobasidium torrendii FP15055 ss-10]|uniref:Uncharacterized protein n=1 Tax=Cylindrobasidium torrendii FP15055 ss-10 TaxID=1314674 RepID=A0A0D7BMK2_9AGAR|nr:hypothetical protein CYLTODRAFT_103302 [Cylindrobasidium torrendii FP15055 ss-10]
MAEPLRQTPLEDAPHTMQNTSLLVPTAPQQQSPTNEPVAVEIETPRHQIHLIHDMSQDEQLSTPVIAELVTPTDPLQDEGSALAVGDDMPNHTTEPTNMELLPSWPITSPSSTLDSAPVLSSAPGDLLEDHASSNMQREQSPISGAPTPPERQDIGPKPEKCPLLDDTQIMEPVCSNSPLDLIGGDTVDRAQAGLDTSLPTASSVRGQQALEGHSPPPEDVGASELVTLQALQPPQEDRPSDTTPGLPAVLTMELSAAISIDDVHGVEAPLTIPSSGTLQSTTAPVLEQPLTQDTCLMDIDYLVATEPSDTSSTRVPDPLMYIDAEGAQSTSELTAPAPVDSMTPESDILPPKLPRQQDEIAISEHTEAQVDARPELPAQKVPRVPRKAFDPIQDAIQTATAYPQAIAIEQTNSPNQDRPATPVKKDFSEAFPPPLAKPVRRATSPLQTHPPQAQARPGSAPPAAEAFPFLSAPPPPSSEPPVQLPSAAAQTDTPKKVVKRKRVELDADSTNGHSQTAMKRTRQQTASALAAPASGSTKPKPAGSTSKASAAKPKAKPPTQSNSNRRALLFHLFLKALGSQYG